MQFLLPSAAQELKWKWETHTHTVHILILLRDLLRKREELSIQTEFEETNSPAYLTRIDGWNSLSSQILRSINGAGNGFTSDGWTADTRRRGSGSSQLLTSGTATELISVLEDHQIRHVNDYEYAL